MDGTVRSEFLHDGSKHSVSIPPSKPFVKSLKSSVKELLFPDDPFRQFKNQPAYKRILLGLQYFVPILEWAPRYTLRFFKSDLIAGITIASLAVPQGISYANLGNMPPIIGLYSSFVPPLIYAMLGSSKDLAIGPTAVASMLMATMLGKVVNPTEDPKQYVQLAFTATFFAGVFQASLGFFRLGFLVELLSHPAIVGFTGGAATTVCLSQLKGILGLHHFATKNDIISVLQSIFTQSHEWRWQPAVLACCFLLFLTFTKLFSKKKPKFFWLHAIAPAVSIIVGSLLVYIIHAEKQVQVIGHLVKGLNPLSVSELAFKSPYLMTAIKTGITIAVLDLVEATSVARSFAMLKNYHLDGNKEMVALGMMNIVGSCTSCYITAGPFSRTAVNFSAGCKTAMSNIVMAITIMLTLLFLTPLLYYIPLVVLSCIIINAMIGLINFPAAIHLWKVDKYDFFVCISAYMGVIFESVDTGLFIAVSVSSLRLILRLARPRTSVLGNIPDSKIYRNIDQYPDAKPVPGVLILQIDTPIYFPNASYLRERISRWICEEEYRLKCLGESNLQYLILDMSSVGSIDTSGMSMLEEVQRNVEMKGLQLMLVNPQSEVIKKLSVTKIIESIGKEHIYLTVGDAIASASCLQQSCTSR